MRPSSITKYFAAFLFSFTLIAASAQPVKVTIVETNNGYSLMRNNQPYFIKGAGGTNYIERLAAYGGNSVRTWGSDKGKAVLDKAQKLGLTVTMGLDATAERHGFNYDDTAAVRKQLERLRKEVIKYRNHPALLMWGIGNELNLEYKNPKVWDAVNDISKMIHQEDPNHPVTTMLAGVNPLVMPEVIARCTDLDLLAVQVYGGLAKVPEELQQSNWKKAYIVTEWGPTGHWECTQTPWKASIEETSSQKADVYKTRYEASIQKDASCLGSYVFLWGQKQERTPTWYGLFTETGEESEVIDVMQYLWNDGKWPALRAPHLDSLTLDGKQAKDFIYLQPSVSYPIFVHASDPNGLPLTNRWELLPESTDLKNGGDYESRPKPITGAITLKGGKIMLKAPSAPGAYRLFLYVDNGKNKVATANIPFYIN